MDIVSSSPISRAGSDYRQAETVLVSPLLAPFVHCERGWHPGVLAQSGTPSLRIHTALTPAPQDCRRRCLALCVASGTVGIAVGFTMAALFAAVHPHD